MPYKEIAMILVAGEILFDVFPEYRRIGGAPFNFAFHLKKLGFDVRFVSRVGRDDRGKEILDFLKAHDFSLEDIQIDPDHETGSVEVKIDSTGGHDFDIKTDAAYDYLEFTDHVKRLAGENAGLIYFGTMVQRTDKGFRTLQRILENRGEFATAFLDINLRPRCYTRSTIEESLRAADILKLNLEELVHITGGAEDESLRGPAVESLMKEYSIQHVILTKGENGSELFSGKNRFTEEPKDESRIADTVGAGDAYAAVAAAGFLTGLPEERIILLAGSFAGRICGIKGALPDTDDFYDQLKREIGG
ncbi:MAG: PfkB family carbohydrate kinase [Desulfobacteraceae bacterium]